MLNKKRLVALACVFFLSTAAQADWDSDDDSDSADRGERNAYISCLRTKPVRFHGTIVEAALATPELGTLAFAVQAAGLDGVLSGKGLFTVFAPINAAFDNIPTHILSALLADPAGLLSAVLKYHVIEGKGRRNDPRRTIRGWALETPTVLGQTVFFNRSKEGPQVNQSNADCTIVEADNGKVYFIDSVLQPQF